MKKWLAVSVLAVCMLLLGACGDSTEKPESNVPVSEIMTAIKEQLAKDIEEASGENLLEEDGTISGYVEADLLAEDTDDPFVEMLLERSELDKELLEEGQFLAPMMNVNSNEIIILKAKEEADVGALKEALEREQDVQIGIWEQYLPDQHEKVKKNITKTKGKYLIFLTAEDAPALEAIFDEKVK